MARTGDRELPRGPERTPATRARHRPCRTVLAAGRRRALPVHHPHADDVGPRPARTARDRQEPDRGAQARVLPAPRRRSRGSATTRASGTPVPRRWSRRPKRRSGAPKPLHRNGSARCQRTDAWLPRWGRRHRRAHRRTTCPQRSTAAGPARTTWTPSARIPFSRSWPRRRRSMRRCPATISSTSRVRGYGTSHFSAARRRSACSARVGRCTANVSPTRWASTAATKPGSACSRWTPSARAGSSRTPAAP